MITDSFSRRRLAVVTAVLAVSLLGAFLTLRTSDSDETVSPPSTTIQSVSSSSSSPSNTATDPTNTDAVSAVTTPAPPPSKAPVTTQPTGTTKPPTTVKPPTTTTPSKLVWPNKPPTPLGATVVPGSEDEWSRGYAIKWETTITSLDDMPSVESYVTGLGCVVIRKAPGLTLTFECPGNVQGNIFWDPSVTASTPGGLVFAYTLAKL